MTWKIFELGAPELAAFCYEKLNRKITYLATLKKDGSPRLHPVTPFIGEGMLFIFTEPSSPKIHDLRRDGRYALHSNVVRTGPLVEIQITGSVAVVTDPDIREASERYEASPVVIDSYVLFEFVIERVLVVTYDEDKVRTVRRWVRVETD